MYIFYLCKLSSTRNSETFSVYAGFSTFVLLYHIPPLYEQFLLLLYIFLLYRHLVGVDAHIDPRAVIALLRCPVCALATVRLRCTQTAALACPLAVSATGSARVRNPQSKPPPLCTPPGAPFRFCGFTLRTPKGCVALNN
jgi:hypothetical protein